MEPERIGAQSGPTPEAWYGHASMAPGFGWRVALSILMGIGWICFLIVWLFFFAGDFDIFQNLAIVIVSILVLVGVLGAAWASWGMRMARTTGWTAPQEWRKPILMTIVSIATGLGWVIFLIVWLFFYASDYNGYQNLAILILSLLVVGIITGGGWAIWGLVSKRR